MASSRVKPAITYGIEAQLTEPACPWRRLDRL